MNRIDYILRQAIIDSGISHKALFEATGVQRATIARFIAKETSIRLDKAADLCEVLGLELRPVKRNK